MCGTVLESGCFFNNKSGERINWQYVKELHNLQCTDNLVLANKLKGKHVNCDNNKMNVKLAAQVLSSSVAEAIDFANENLKLPQFSNVKLPQNLSESLMKHLIFAIQQTLWPRAYNQCSLLRIWQGKLIISTRLLITLKVFKTPMVSNSCIQEEKRDLLVSSAR